jgi:hypothetical protein
MGKLVLGVSVNCAMQPAEIGRVEVDDVFLTHPETGVEGYWIYFERPKTHEHGEWLLWDEVGELVVWGVERAKSLGAQRIIVNDNGTPWYRDESANPHHKFSKWWSQKPSGKDYHKGVITRVQETCPDFPYYPIKSLRKILPNLVRPNWGREVSDLVNARHVDDAGQVRHVAANGKVANAETDRYSDRLYDVVAEAIRGLKPDFQVFLDQLK